MIWEETTRGQTAGPHGGYDRSPDRSGEKAATELRILAIRPLTVSQHLAFTGAGRLESVGTGCRFV